MIKKDGGWQMTFLFAAMWAAAGLILIFRMGKENKVFYLVGGLFLFMGVWEAAGVWFRMPAGRKNIGFRAAAAAVLLIALAALYRETHRKG